MTASESPGSKASKTTTNSSEAASSPTRPKPTWEIVGAVAVTAILLGLKLYVEHLESGRRVELFTFEFLQARLSPFHAWERLPVLVVDISQIPGGRGQVTPRKELRQLIAAIAQHRPKAIGIDIDFSPNERGWRTDDDPEFFNYCLEITKRVPIFLGVYNTRHDRADVWLGLSNYQSLATNIEIPKEGSTEATTRIPRWTITPSRPEPLPSLSFALAREYVRDRSPPSPSWLLKLAIEIPPANPSPESLHGTPITRSIHTMLNYSKLDQLRHETIPTISPTSVDEFKKFYAGKMVILGDATEATDNFNPPGRGATPGVYLHAVAAYTLAVEPVYELKPGTRAVLDIMASLVVVGVAWWRNSRVTVGPGDRPKDWKVIWTAVALLVAFGVFLVNQFQIMWLDFVFVGIALLVHPYFEQGLHIAKKWLDGKRQLPA